jgi:hypothetical protein
MGRTTVEELDLDAFLGHSGSSGGGGTFLKNWKDDERIDIWLHPKAKIIPLWSHNWYTIGKDRETHDPVLRSVRFNSMEREVILKKRNYRDDKTGEREYPPEACPFSRMLEWVYQAIKSRTLSWVDEIFLFDEIPGDPTVIHAGGFAGLFNNKDMDRDEVKELRQAGIRRDEAWKESAQPRMQYIFRVVKNAAPAEGCLIALEAQALGDKVRRVIADRIDDVGRVKGDPFQNPYAIRWAYDDKAEFSKKYEARLMSAMEITPELQAVFDVEPPSINELVRPSNVKELRASFEAHWCHKTVRPPWNEIFAGVDVADDDGPEDDDPTAFDYGDNAASAATTAAADDDIVECDVCSGVMPGTVFECPHCGTQYDPKTNAILKRGEWPKPDPKQEPKPRTRSKGKA